jgi:hypothetical protein
MTDSPKLFYDKNIPEKEYTFQNLVSDSDSDSDSQKSVSSTSRSSASPVSFFIKNKNIEFAIDLNNNSGRILLHYFIGIGTGIVAGVCLGGALGGMIGLLYAFILNFLYLPFVLLNKKNASYEYEPYIFGFAIIGGTGVGIVGALIGFLISTLFLPFILFYGFLKKQKMD